MHGATAGGFDGGAFFAQIQRGIKGVELLPKGGGPEAEARAWTAWHAYLAQRSDPTCHFDSLRFGDAMRTHWPGLADLWLTLSDQLVDGQYAQANKRVPYVPGKGVDWQCNVPGATGWGPGMHYMFFLRWPIRAAMLTGKSQYVHFVSDCLRSYLAQMDDIQDERHVVSPDGEEVSFTVWNTLALGLKLKALGEALYALRDHPDWSVDDCRGASILIWRHAEYLHRLVSPQASVEWQKQLNFISSGSGGLGLVGALLPEWGAAAGWLEMGRQIQEVLLLNQVHPDGMQKEICTQYHKTVIRSFAVLQMTLARRGLPSFYDTEPYRTRFLAMHRFLAEVVTPEGYTPAINSAVYAMDWVVFLAASNAYFRDPVLKWHVRRWYRPEFLPVQKGGPGWGASILSDLSDPLPKGVRTRAPRASSTLFAESGIAVLRDGWGPEANVLVLDFGNPDGGHAYAARSSFTAWVKGRPAALSPGSPFSYQDPDYKPWYYGTRGQNTVWVDGEDHEIWRPGRKRRMWGRLLDWRESRDETRIRMSHEGYVPSKGVRHERTVILMKERFFLIYDVLDGASSAKSRLLQWTLRCPDALEAGDDRVALSSGDPGLRIVPAWPEGIEDVELGWGPSMVPLRYRLDMSAQQGQTCHVRYGKTLAAGSRAYYLMLLVAGDCPDAAIDVDEHSGQLHANVTAWGEGHVLEME